MAASLPAVASPVGANRGVIVPGETGFFAADPGEWTARLRELLTAPERSAAMGRAARASARRFDRRATVARVTELLRELA